MHFGSTPKFHGAWVQIAELEAERVQAQTAAQESMQAHETAMEALQASEEHIAYLNNCVAEEQQRAAAAQAGTRQVGRAPSKFILVSPTISPRPSPAGWSSKSQSHAHAPRLSLSCMN